MIAAMLAVTVGGCYIGSAVVARHRAQSAADLAAVAAAARLVAGADVACGQASAVTQAMRTVLASCVVDQLDVIVAVDAPVALGAWGFGPAHAMARAGPVEAAG